VNLICHLDEAVGKFKQVVVMRGDFGQLQVVVTNELNHLLEVAMIHVQ
jgi:hypothetical protein